MKKLIIVTYIDFWRGGAGFCSRLLAVMNYLRSKVALTVVYIGVYREGDEEILSEDFKDIQVDFLEREKMLDLEGYVKKFAEYIKGKVFDIALLEYVEMYFLLQYFPKTTVTVLDTHDIVSDRVKSFKQFGIKYNGIVLTYEEELELFKAFDYIILINKNDYEKIKRNLPQKNLLLMPHPVNFPPQILREKVQVLSYIASGYPPNVDAIEWFLDKVWPLISVENLVLNICGHVTTQLKVRDYESMNVRLIGFVNDLEHIYRTSDIIINPIRAGAGLKIKNVEALGHGLPLITTSHGISGIEDALPTAVMVADHASDFIESINKLCLDFNFRKSLATNAYKYARKKFSEEICLGPIEKILN